MTEKQEKIISINFKALKSTAVSKGKKAGNAALGTLNSATKGVRSKAMASTGKVVGSVLDKTINLTESQLKSLKRLKEKATAR